MPIRNIQLKSYRNLPGQTVEFDEGINLFVGDNGQGKTNLLEAVHLLATLRSFRSAATSDLIQHGRQSAEVSGLVISEDTPIQMKIILGRGGKRLWIGGNPVRGVQDYLGKLRVIAFTPDDLAMVKGGPSVRRRFLDRAVFLFRPEHVSWVRDFNAALKARNHLLKSRERPDGDVLDSFSQKMAGSGARVTGLRRAILDDISGFAREILSEMEEGDERLSLEFNPGWDTGGGCTATELVKQLERNLDRDLRRGQTSIGPQQDDLAILYDNRSARKFASQGQQRSCALALMLAVVRAVIDRGEERPVILLDDVSSELDAERRDRLFAQIRRIGSQVLVTTTDENLVSGLTGEVSARYRVVDGTVEREKH